MIQGLAPIFLGLAVDLANLRKHSFATWCAVLHLPKTSNQKISGCWYPIDFLQRVADCVWNRHLIKTSENRFSLVPKAIETNDLIAILQDCSIPVVIQPRGNYYTVIGEAYIHGLMDGDGMTWKEETMVPLQEFVLL